jgi:hypothetical protein
MLWIPKLKGQFYNCYETDKLVKAYKEQIQQLRTRSSIVIERRVQVPKYQITRLVFLPVTRHRKHEKILNLL